MAKKLTQDDLLNWWLEKYHNTNVEKVLIDNPDWDVHSKDWNSRTFYEKYPVTQQQHDEWYKWALDTFAKHFRLSKKQATRSFSFTYLDTAPSIIKDDKV